MGIALYYIVLVGAVIGSACYLRSGVRLMTEAKTAEENRVGLRTIALWKIAVGAFGTILWVTVVAVSIYNQSSSTGK